MNIVKKYIFTIAAVKFMNKINLSFVGSFFILHLAPVIFSYYTAHTNERSYAIAQHLTKR